jgi:hypothetical protein
MKEYYWFYYKNNLDSAISEALIFKSKILKD